MRGGHTYRFVLDYARAACARSSTRRPAPSMQRLEYDAYGRVLSRPARSASSRSATPAGCGIATPASCTSARASTTREVGRFLTKDPIGFDSGVLEHVRLRGRRPGLVRRSRPASSSRWRSPPRRSAAGSSTARWRASGRGTRAARRADRRAGRARVRRRRGRHVRGDRRDALTKNPWVGGAIGGVAAEITSEELAPGHRLDPVAIGVAVATGLPIGEHVFKTVGRLPNLWRPRGPGTDAHLRPELVADDRPERGRQRRRQPDRSRRQRCRPLADGLPLQRLRLALDLPGLAGRVLDGQLELGLLGERQRLGAREAELARLGQRGLLDLRAVAAGRDADRVAVAVALDRDDGRAADDLEGRADRLLDAVVAGERGARPSGGCRCRRRG